MLFFGERKIISYLIVLPLHWILSFPAQLASFSNCRLSTISTLAQGIHNTLSIPQYNLMDATVSIYDVVANLLPHYPMLHQVIREHVPEYWLEYLAETGVFTPYPAVRHLIHESYALIQHEVRDEIQKKLKRRQPMQQMDVLNLIVANILNKNFSKHHNGRMESYKCFDVGPFLQSWEKRLVDEFKKQEPNLYTTEHQAIYILKVFIMGQNQGPPDRPFLTPQHFNTIFEDYYEGVLQDYDYYNQQSCCVQIKEQLARHQDYNGQIQPIGLKLQEFCDDQEEKIMRVLQSSRYRKPPDKIAQQLQKEISQSMPQAILGQVQNKQDQSYGKGSSQIQSRSMLQTKKNEQKPLQNDQGKDLFAKQNNKVCLFDIVIDSRIKCENGHIFLKDTLETQPDPQV